MEAQIELRNPTVVVVGAWNQAIVNNPNWLAIHVLGKQQGDQVTLNVAQRGSDGRQTILLENAGVGCVGDRLELHSYAIDDFSGVYSTISKLCELLPHTPVWGVGVNFTFVLADELGEFDSKLQTLEPINTLGTIKESERKDVVELENNRVLTLTRALRPNGKFCDFNYHRTINDLGELQTLVGADFVANEKQDAQQLVSDFYGIEEFGVTAFNLGGS